jgi:hypothetical protein
VFSGLDLDMAKAGLTMLGDEDGGIARVETAFLAGVPSGGQMVIIIGTDRRSNLD